MAKYGVEDIPELINNVPDHLIQTVSSLTLKMMNHKAYGEA
jgi:hypothetical protein